MYVLQIIKQIFRIYTVDSLQIVQRVTELSQNKARYC